MRLSLWRDLRRSSSKDFRMWVQAMSETMEQIMEREKAEAIATLNRANGALSRLFGIEVEPDE